MPTTKENYTKALLECLVSDNLASLKGLFNKALGIHIGKLLEDIRDQNQDRIGSTQDLNYADTIATDEYPINPNSANTLKEKRKTIRKHK